MSLRLSSHLGSTIRSLLLACSVVMVMTHETICLAQVADPFDTATFGSSSDIIAEDDANKSAETLVEEATVLFDNERFLDGRTKLIQALKKDPTYYQTHLMLAGYYLATVGHYRLSLRYVREAQRLFQEKKGTPPYMDLMARAEHAHMLNLLSQVRLNLDNYQGALEVLNQYAALGYYSSWYPSTRAWVLMKLGQLDEATRVARQGVLLSADPGRTLNMLGILLSMQKQREQSIQVFRKALEYEFSQGTQGQPATPLNNMGEVFEEIFDEDKAESAYLRATGLSDGCEHVLPALNLSLLYIEQMNWSAAKKTMDGFISCMAQFPLRNGEEHRALVHLARGRIDLHTGRVSEAIAHFEDALARQQWFGKIGTSVEDLRAAALISMAQALTIQNNIESLKVYPHWGDRLEYWRSRLERAVRSRWLMRRARQMLLSMNEFEDLYIRNTDSLIEYPTLGDLLAGFPQKALLRKLEHTQDNDNRPVASNFYAAYRMQRQVVTGSTKGIDQLRELRRKLREKYDDLLKLQLDLVTLRTLSPDSANYDTVAFSIFERSRAALRNHGYRLPVRAPAVGNAIEHLLAQGPFILTEDKNIPYEVRLAGNATETLFELYRNGTLLTSVKGTDVPSTVNLFFDGVFSEEVK